MEQAAVGMRFLAVEDVAAESGANIPYLQFVPLGRLAPAGGEKEGVLLPAIAAYVWQFGPGILIQLALASVTALTCEAFMLALRKRPIRAYLADLSALVTAWLIALAFPAIAPWWLVVTGTAS